MAKRPGWLGALPTLAWAWGDPATRRRRRNAVRYSLPSVGHRRLALEPLESRTLLSLGWPESASQTVEVRPTDGSFPFQIADGEFYRGSEPPPGTVANDRGAMAPFENAVQPPAPITMAEMEHLDPSGGDLWLRCETSRQGYLTLEVPGGLATLTLYDENRNVLAVSNEVEGNQRIDWPAQAAGETYYVDLSGTHSDVTLRLANLVNRQGDRVTVYGTDGEDEFVLDCASPSTLRVNGIAYRFADDPVHAIDVDGLAGADAAELYGSSADETVTLDPNGGSLQGPGLTVTLSSVAWKTVYAGKGMDRVTMFDSANSDVFVGRATVSTLSAEGYCLCARGFDEVHAIATAGTGDVARLYDSAGDETFVATPREATLTGNRFKYVATAFGATFAYARYGGMDKAELYDGPDNDSFSARPTYATLSGPGFFNRAMYFEEVRAFATAGGSNGARMYDSGGIDTLIARPTETTLSGVGYSNIAVGFRSVYAYAFRGGKDVAYLYDTRWDDRFVGRPGYGFLTGRGYTRLARAFDMIYADASSGGRDLAYLYDSEDDDHLEARQNWVELHDVGLTEYYHKVVDFEGVRVIASTGRNTKHMVVPLAFGLKTEGPWEKVDAALVLTNPSGRKLYQRDESNRAQVVVEGQFAGTVTRIEARAVPMQGYSGTGTSWQPLDFSPSEGVFSGLLTLEAGWYQIQVWAFCDADRVAQTWMDRIGVGEIFITAGQSNAANSGAVRLTPRDDRVSAGDCSIGQWQLAADPQPIASGDRGSPWPAMGDLLAAQLDVPVGFVSLGRSGSQVADWLPGGWLYRRLAQTVAFLGPHGFRAILWQQGESDAEAGTSAEDYAQRLDTIIQQSRTDAGWNVPWFVALASYRPGFGPNPDVLAGQQRVIDSDPLVFAGPRTDDMIVPYREGSGYQGIHFNEAGLRELARRWLEVVIYYCGSA